MADKVNLLHIPCGVVKRLDHHARQFLKAADLALGRFAVARKINADQRAPKAERLFERGPGLAVCGKAMQQDHRVALAFSAGDVQRAGFGCPAG